MSTPSEVLQLVRKHAAEIEELKGSKSTMAASMYKTMLTLMKEEHRDEVIQFQQTRTGGGGAAAGAGGGGAAAIVAPAAPAAMSTALQDAGGQLVELDAADVATPPWAHKAPELGYNGNWHYNWSKPKDVSWKDFCSDEVRKYEGGFLQGKCAAATPEHVYLLVYLLVYLTFTSSFTSSFTSHLPPRLPTCFNHIYLIFTSYLHHAYLMHTSCRRRPRHPHRPHCRRPNHSCRRRPHQSVWQQYLPKVSPALGAAEGHQSGRSIPPVVTQWSPGESTERSARLPHHQMSVGR